MARRGKYAAVKFPCGGRQLVFVALLGKDLCSVVAVGPAPAPPAERLCEPDFKRLNCWQNQGRKGGGVEVFSLALSLCLSLSFVSFDTVTKGSGGG